MKKKTEWLKNTKSSFLLNMFATPQSKPKGVRRILQEDESGEDLAEPLNEKLLNVDLEACLQGD